MYSTPPAPHNIHSTNSILHANFGNAINSAQYKMYLQYILQYMVQLMLLRYCLSIILFKVKQNKATSVEVQRVVT